MAVKRKAPVADTGLSGNVIPFPQINVDAEPFFPRAVAEEFFESLDAIFMKNLHRRLTEAKARAGLGMQGAAKDVETLALQIEMRVRQRERIRSSVVFRMMRWRDAEMGMNFGTAGLFGESAATVCRTRQTTKKKSKRKIDAARDPKLHVT